MTVGRRLPAEWEPQDFVMLALPHAQTDWCYMLDEVIGCYTHIISTILRYQNVVLLCNDTVEASKRLSQEITGTWREGSDGDMAVMTTTDDTTLTLVQVETNDTWARDFGGITVFDSLLQDGGQSRRLPKTEKRVLDFGFNGWGLKFAANSDNLVTKRLFARYGDIWSEYKYLDLRQIILEGGSIESDGQGTILTTEQCLLSDNRNYQDKSCLEALLSRHLGVNRFLWLRNGALQGDDTDSHIDTLARFCNEDTIAYVQCTDTEDAHYNELRAMEEELKAFRNGRGLPYSLVPLPMADEVVVDGERLPATYDNFLIINGAVLVPSYGSPQKDELARRRLQDIFPDRKVILVDCLPLIKQHGSLHCITMQFPK